MASENLVNDLFEIIQSNTKEKLSYNDFEKDLLMSIDLPNEDVDRALTLIVSQAKVNPNLIGDTKGGKFVISPSFSATINSTIKYENQFIPGKKEYLNREQNSKNAIDFIAGAIIMSPELINHFVDNIDKISSTERRALVGSMSKMTYDQRKRVLSYFKKDLKDLKENAPTEKDAAAIEKVEGKVNLTEEMDDAIQAGDVEAVRDLASSDAGIGTYGFKMVDGQTDSTNKAYVFNLANGQLSLVGIENNDRSVTPSSPTHLDRNLVNSVYWENSFNTDNPIQFKLQVQKNGDRYFLVAEGAPKEFVRGQLISLRELEKLTGERLADHVVLEQFGAQNVKTMEKVLDVSEILRVISNIDQARLDGDIKRIKELLNGNMDILKYANLHGLGSVLNLDEVVKEIMSGKVSFDYSEVVDQTMGVIQDGVNSHLFSETETTLARDSALHSFGETEKKVSGPQKNPLVISLEKMRDELVQEYSIEEIEEAMGMFRSALVAKQKGVETYDIDSEEMLREQLLTDSPETDNEKTRKAYEKIVAYRFEEDLFDLLTDDYIAFVDTISEVKNGIRTKPIPDAPVDHYVELNAVEMAVADYRSIKDQFHRTNYEQIFKNTDKEGSDEKIINNIDADKALFKLSKGMFRSVRTGQIEESTAELNDIGKSVGLSKNSKDKDIFGNKDDRDEDDSRDDEPGQ